jgi:uncharacterized protein (DUF58 family)
MIDTQFLSGLARFNLIIRKRVTSNYAGAKKSISQGRGMIFKDHRIYAPGDDFRAIDWKVFARTDDLMVKNYEEERNLIVHILVDKSMSMNYGKPKKFEYAAMLGVGYAYVAMKKNDKFQFATFSDDFEVYQPRRGLSQVMAMIDYLNGIKLSGKTDILNVAKKYNRMIGSRSLLVIISDFLAPIDEVKEALHYFKANEVVLIQVLDPVERNPDFEGDFKLKDSESNEAIRAFLSLKSKQDYLDLMSRHESEIKHTSAMLNADYFTFTTDMPIFDAFYRLLS